MSTPDSEQSWDVVGALDAAMSVVSPSQPGFNTAGTFSDGGFSRVRFSEALRGVVGEGQAEDDDDDDVGGSVKPFDFGEVDEDLSGEPRVRVVHVEHPSHFCRGLLVGASDRFCLRETEECKVKRHQTKKADILAGYCYIMCPKAGWAYVTQFKRGEDWREQPHQILCMELGVSEWQRYFKGVVDEPLVSVDDAESRRIDMLEGAIQSRTPNKKPRFAIAEIPGWTPLPDDSITDSRLFLEWIWTNWSIIGDRLSLMGKSVNGVTRVIGDMTSEAGRVGTAVSIIRAELGDRTDQDQDRDIWTAVRNLRQVKGIDGNDLDSVIKKLTEVGSRCQQIEQHMDGLESQVKSTGVERDDKHRHLIQQLRGLADAFPKHVGPCRVLVDKHTTRGGSDYGDLLDDRLIALETDRKMSTPKSHSGVGGGVDPEDFAALQRQVSALLDKTARQDTELKQLRGRVGQTQVEIHGEVFQSCGDVEDFIGREYPAYTKGLFFDAVSLLQIMHGNMGKSGDEVIESEYHAKRSNYGSDLEAKYSASFKAVVLPSIFVGSGAGGSSSSVLPAVKDHTAWNPQDGLHEGMQQKILNGIENQVGSMQAAFENIYPVGSKLATISNQLLGDSILFIKTMSYFISDFYIELSRTSSSGDAGNWSLTCQIIHRLFKDLAIQRNGGGEARMIEDPVARGAKYLWLTLQAHRVMKEYVTSKFREHPSIAPMLNISLFKTMVPLETFNNLKDVCKKIELTAQGAKVTADKAMSAANAAKGGVKKDVKP